jgi:hypothetical protein
MVSCDTQWPIPPLRKPPTKTSAFFYDILETTSFFVLDTTVDDGHFNILLFLQGGE